VVASVVPVVPEDPEVPVVDPAVLVLPVAPGVEPLVPAALEPDVSELGVEEPLGAVVAPGLVPAA
jgi:hypothetical protein